MDAETSLPDPGAARLSRRRALGEARRDLILDAARRVIEAGGVEGASLRAVAAEAGYTPAALYFHFPSKEAIQVELLERSLGRLAASIRRRLNQEDGPSFVAGAEAIYGFYLTRPSDLDLALHLLRGGMRPKGLGDDQDLRVTAALAEVLRPLAEEAERRGSKPKRAHLLAADAFAHAIGLLVVAKSGRIRTLDASATRLMERYLDARDERIGER